MNFKIFGITFFYNKARGTSHHGAFIIYAFNRIFFMRTWAPKLFALLFLLSSCNSVNNTSRPLYDLSFDGVAAQMFSTHTKRAWGGSYIVESSLVNFGGEIISFYADLSTPIYAPTYYTASLDDGLGFTNPLINNAPNMAHSYLLEHDNVYYQFGQVGGDIYLWKSEDFETWIEMNNGEPVLSRVADTHLSYLWNVGVAVDSLGVWHLLVESASKADQLDVGLAYSTATLVGDNIDFDTNISSDHVIPHGGNPELKFASDDTLLVIHGQANDPYGKYGVDWYTTATTFDGSTWTTHKDKFLIGTPSVMVCDPHLIETPNGMVMSISMDQRYIYMLQSSNTLDELVGAL